MFSKEDHSGAGRHRNQAAGPCCFFVDLKLQLQRRATVPSLHILTTTSSFTGTRQALPGSSFKCIWRKCSLYYKTPAAVLQHILQDHAAVMSFSNGPVCRRRGPSRTRMRGTRRNVSVFSPADVVFSPSSTPKPCSASVPLALVGQVVESGGRTCMMKYVVSGRWLFHAVFHTFF